MKKKIVEALRRALHFVLTNYDKAIDKVTTPIIGLYMKYINRADIRQRNRRILLLASSVIILDYLLICYHVDRNPLDIFPGIPKLESREEVTVYVSDLDGKSLIKETRLTDTDDTKENFALELVNFVVKGSNFENTKVAIPIQGNVRKIWFFGNKCVVDFRFEILPDEIEVIPGSEETFRKALEATIKANIKGVDEVIVSENGIPLKKIWEPFTQAAAPEAVNQTSTPTQTTTSETKPL